MKSFPWLGRWLVAVAAPFLNPPGALASPLLSGPIDIYVDDDMTSLSGKKRYDAKSLVPHPDFGGGNQVPTSSIDNLDSDDNMNGSADFYEVKGANFDPDRAMAFRYHLSAAPPTTSSGGWGEVGGNDTIEYNHDPGTRMHEWGHNLNLRHGGF